MEECVVQERSKKFLIKFFDAFEKADKECFMPTLRAFYDIEEVQYEKGDRIERLMKAYQDNKKRLVENLRKYEGEEGRDAGEQKERGGGYENIRLEKADIEL